MTPDDPTTEEVDDAPEGSFENPVPESKQDRCSQCGYGICHCDPDDEDTEDPAEDPGGITAGMPDPGIPEEWFTTLHLPDADLHGFRVRGTRPLGDPAPELIRKLCDARLTIEDLGPVPKSGYNKHIDHHYSTPDDVHSIAGPGLAHAGIWHTSSILDTVKEDSGKTTSKGFPIWRVTAVMEVRLTDGESWIGRVMIGEKEGSGDKNHGALESYLLRYALAKMLLLESGDSDVDDEHVASSTATDATGRKKVPAVFIPDRYPGGTQVENLEEDGWTWDEDRRVFKRGLSGAEIEEQEKRRRDFGEVTKDRGQTGPPEPDDDEEEEDEVVETEQAGFPTDDDEDEDEGPGDATEGGA